MAGFWSLRYSASKARFDERKVQGERGGYGGLTGPKDQEREAVEAARCSADRSSCGGARGKRCCSWLGRRKRATDEMGRRRGRLFMRTDLLGRDGIKEIVAGTDTSDGMGWSPSC